MAGDGFVDYCHYSLRRRTVWILFPRVSYNGRVE